MHPPFLCPHCHEGTLRVGVAGARCEICGATFAVRDGVLDLVPDLPSRRTLAQATLELETVVRIYESRLWRRSPAVAAAFGVTFDDEVDLILEAAAPKAGCRMLDIACGPGNYSRELASRVGSCSVVGLDISMPMLRTAVSLARRRGLDNLLFVRASAMDLPFPAGSFDAVNCCGALHLFPDVARALSEVRRVLAPSGRFTVAAVRQPALPLASLGGLLLQRLAGIRQFTEQGLESRLTEAGLGDVRFAHSKRAWLVASAAKVG
jgi:SAM-dependent methyltransferase